MVFTALGDAVNVAARLQDMTKSLACEAVISDEVRTTAGLPTSALPAQEVTIRGRNEPMVVRTVTYARELSTMVNEEHVAAA
jgi:adenylate cyclase